ncbi:MAG: hypothetical protein NT018_12895 [Armatimonadetes bacterium]|nr:hypothetical protein [Armatimonadota bacterium]
MELEEKTTCPRHPKVQTALRCPTCGILICPSCLVHTPVGAKCRACGSHQGAALFNPSLPQLLYAGAVAIAAGAFAGWAVAFEIGLFTFFLAFLYGQFAAGAAIRASGRKRGIKLQIVVGVGMAAGVVGGRLLMAGIILCVPGQFQPPHGIWSVILNMSPIEPLSVAIAIGSAVSRIKYL